MKSYLPFYLFLALSLFYTRVFAQIVSGTVTSGGKAVPGTSIYSAPSGTGGSTDVDGHYSLTLKAGTWRITFSAIGYDKKIVTVTIAGGENKVVNVELANSLESLKEVIVVGSRGGGRTKLESAVPVDVIRLNQVTETTAKPDLMSQLNQTVPSFNYNKQSGADGADAIDLASLRGLGFDQTLVLVNGIRRHLTAYVDAGQSARGRGNSGTDLNAIPESAIDHVEILRDGASAQYGSDAIAGVINIVLKKDVNHLNFTAGFSGYNDQRYNTLSYPDPKAYYTGKKFDGQTLTLGADYGVSIGKKGGFLNIGGDYQNAGKTFRDVTDLAISRERRAFGDGSIAAGGGMFNMELPIAGTSASFYAFGGYNYKHSQVYAYTRSWNYNNGVRENPTKFPTDPTTGDLIFVPGIMKVDAPGGAPFNADNVYYDPEEDVYIKDASTAFGFKGKLGDDWQWNISNNVGRNDFHYYGQNTFNAALPYIAGQPIQTRFDDGGFNYLQNTTNADITRHFSNVVEGLQLSFGGEIRYERYQVYAGEPNSYIGDTTHVPIRVDGVTTRQVKASGSEGYPGYSPSDTRIANRGSEGAYAEMTLDVTKRWLIDLAERFENYDDFGFVGTEKFATRYKVTDNFNLRGSISTGFRAPSLQQMNFSNTNTEIVNGNLVYTKTVPNYSPIARAAGIPKLTPETSTNYSLGFTWAPVNGLTFTVDAYQAEIKNRIVFSGQYAEGDPSFGNPNTPGTLNSLLLANQVAQASFYTNAVNTTNRGVDIVADYRTRWNNQHFSATFAGNIQHVMINQINVPSTFKGSASDSALFFSDREQYFLKYAAPTAKLNLGLEYGIGKWALGTRFTYFGTVKELGFGDISAPAGAKDPFFPYVALDNGGAAVPEIFVFTPKVTTDIYVSLKVSKNLSWNIGVDNLFNVHPDENVVKGSVNPISGTSSFGDSNSGGPFESVQMGFNGMRIFTKLKLNL
ncbi:MAG: TonB-dependent receptor [Mucilaginibacter sp.]